MMTSSFDVIQNGLLGIAVFQKLVKNMAVCTVRLDEVHIHIVTSQFDSVIAGNQFRKKRNFLI
jgi:hypothetical protein